MLKNILKLNGYLIQNFRDGEIHDIYSPPEKEESWERITAITPTWSCLTYKYMKLGQISFQKETYSEIDVDIPVVLEDPTPLTLEQYDWGDLIGKFPKKRNKYVYLFLGDGTETPILEDRLHKYLARYLDEPGEKEGILEKRRELSKADIIQRALEIDADPQALAGLRAQANDETFTLDGAVQIFFSELSLEMYQYINAGSLVIVDKINTYLDQIDAGQFNWLKYQLPGVPSLGQFIAQSLALATQPIASLEVATFWELFKANGFVKPTAEEVAIAVSAKITTLVSTEVAALGFTTEFNNFRTKYLTNVVDIAGIKAIAPLSPLDENQQNWLFEAVESTSDLLKDMDANLKNAIGIHPEAAELNLKELVLYHLFKTS